MPKEKSDRTEKRKDPARKKERTRKGGNKLKLLMILLILQKDSSEEHPLTREMIADRLEKESIFCDRRTFSNDMELLKNIAHVGERKLGRKKAFYVSSRDLTDTEIKILIDAVQAASFLTVDSTELFVKKLAKIGGRTLSQRVAQSYLAFKVRKRKNDEIWDNVECIRTALYEGKQISFVYNDRDINRNWVPRNNGGRYLAEPLTLYISDDRYYALCYGKDGSIIKYRVDRMTEVALEKKKNISQPALDKRNELPAYLSGLFSMYGGQSVNISLIFKKELAEAIFDNFGEDVECREAEDAPGWARAAAKVCVADTFFSWLANYRGKIRLEGPKDIVRQYETFLKDNLRIFGEAEKGAGKGRKG
jgi:predicted DNA-binding transcriptional regulator YafY